MNELYDHQDIALDHIKQFVNQRTEDLINKSQENEEKVEEDDEEDEDRKL